MRRSVRQREVADRRLVDVEEVEGGVDDGELAFGVTGGPERPAEWVGCDQGTGHGHLLRYVGECADVDAHRGDAGLLDRSLYVSN